MRLNTRERVKLLAATYLDACVATQTTASLQTKFLVMRVDELWNEGSYWELERAMDELRAGCRKQHLWFWRCYVQRFSRGYSKDLPPNLAPHKRHAAEQGLSAIERTMLARTQGNVYVPQIVSKWAGFEAAAREAASPRALRKAA